jgi:hypothetical protein
MGSAGHGQRVRRDTQHDHDDRGRYADGHDGHHRQRPALDSGVALFVVGLALESRDLVAVAGVLANEMT